MIGYDDLVDLRTTAERARALATRSRRPELIRAAEEAEAHLASALDGTVGRELDPAVPLLLLPVRIETRYRSAGRRGTELLVRIYPEVDIDEHEPPLTQNEIDAGQAFWNSVWAAPEGDAGDPTLLAAWTQLVTRVGRLRAAWVLGRCSCNPRTTGHPATRQSSRNPRSRLPDGPALAAPFFNPTGGW